MAENAGKRKSGHWLIAGSDEFAVKERTRALLATLAPEDPMNFEVVDAQADTVEAARQRLVQLQEALLTLPFFGGSKLVHFKSCPFLADSVTGRSETVLEGWQGVAETLRKVGPEEVSLVISAGPVDKRRSFFKAFSSLGTVEFFDLPDLGRGRDLQAFVSGVEGMFREAGLQPEHGVAELMVELVGGNTRGIHGEIEKLALFAHPEKRITEAHLRTMVASTRESIIWDLNDAVIEGDTTHAIYLVRQLLAQGESEVGMGILLAGQVRLAALGTHLLETKRLRLVKQGYGVNVEITQEGMQLVPENKKGEKPSGFRLARIVERARKRSAARWFHAVDFLHQTAFQLVSSGGDRRRILEAAVIRLCQI
ncbi:MAG: DNA polymerase III subunit delta [Candidatus Methylacidiphilales bacterium]|nr:DNA polymerase III subunit delta [Candidatus Methylacidiphilales bacterium]